MMVVQAGGKPEMMNESDSDDDKPIVFKRNNTESKQNLLNTQVKNSSSQKLDGKSGRQMSDVCSPNGQNSSVQKGKIVPSTKGSPVISPLASPKASTSSVKASLVKSPVANTKALTKVSDQSKNYSQQNKSTIVKMEKPLGRPHVDPYSDSEDDTPLSHRLLGGASNGSSHHVSKGSSNSVPVLSTFSKPSVKEEDSEDEKPLSLKFQLKSNVGASASNCSDSDENKPLASKLQQNGSGVMDNQLKKSSTALDKRPSAEAKYSVQSSLKKAKLSDASISINCKQVSVKAEPSGKDDADDHVPISQRIKKLATPVSKLSDKMKTTTSISSSVNKINNKSKKVIKKIKFSKSSKVPPGSSEGQKWATLVHNGVIFPPPYKPHGVKMNYKGQPVNLTPEQEEVATMIGVMRDTEYWTKPMFIENFMSDWKKILGKNHIILNFKDCDFNPIYEWHQREKEKKKQMST